MVLLVVSGLLLVDILKLAHKLGIEFILVIFAEKLAGSCEHIRPVSQTLSLVSLLDYGFALGQILRQIYLWHLFDLLLGLSLLCLHLLLILDHLLQQIVVSSFLSKISQVSHGILDLVNSLYHFHRSIWTFRICFFEDVRKYFVDDVRVPTVYCELKSSFLLIDFE